MTGSRTQRKKRKWNTGFGSTRAGQLRSYGFLAVIAVVAAGCHCPLSCGEVHGRFQIQGPDTVNSGVPVVFTIDGVTMPDDSLEVHRDLRGEETCPDQLTWYLEGSDAAGRVVRPVKTKLVNSVCRVDNETLTFTFAAGARTTKISARLVNTTRPDGGSIHNDAFGEKTITVQGGGGGPPGGENGFGPTQPYGGGEVERPEAVDVAQYDLPGGAAGQDDVVVADATESTSIDELHFFPSLANGVLGSPISVTLGNDVDPDDLDSADVDNDGDRDVVVTNLIGGNAAGADDAVQVALNAGGTFSTLAANEEPVASTPTGIDLGDLNNDSFVDVVTTSLLSPGQVSVLENLGPTTPGDFGAFVPHATGGNFPFAVAVADFNADGKRDIAVVNSSGEITVLRNTTANPGDAPTFAAAETVDSFPDGFPRDLVVGDFNEDTKPDIAYANVNENTVSILRNNTAALATDLDFTFTGDLDTGGAAPTSIDVGDLNGDGDLDLVTANRNSDNLSVWLGNGDGSFAAAFQLGAGTRPQSVATGNLNSDVPNDIAAANNGASASGSFGNLTVNLSTPPFPASSRSSLYSSNPDWYRPGPPALASAKGAKAIGRFVKHELLTTGEASFRPDGGLDITGIRFKGKLKLKVKGGKGVSKDLRKSTLKVVSSMNGTFLPAATEIPPPVGDGLIAAKGKGGTKICATMQVDARDAELETLRIIAGTGDARGLRGRGTFLIPNLASPPAKMSMRVKTKSAGGAKFPGRCKRLLKSL